MTYSPWKQGQVINNSNPRVNALEESQIPTPKDDKKRKKEKKKNRDVTWKKKNNQNHPHPQAQKVQTRSLFEIFYVGIRINSKPDFSILPKLGSTRLTCKSNIKSPLWSLPPHFYFYVFNMYYSLVCYSKCITKTKK